MASQSLYRKWRSQNFSEVVGQEPITQTLRNSLSTGRIAHAYLFCGPRGTGKTSSGRILAKALNCRQRNNGEPCNVCEMCRAVAEARAMDLVEIDAASNRGIDEIRDLREKVRFAPSQGQYKVYIIDEVHMLTVDAFNALLKTLEEPPAHVIFVLCTTEAHKVPATVLSRCQRFDFRRIPLSAAVGRLKYIAEQEGIQIDDAGLELVAKASSGSLRDAENLLDQLFSYYGSRVDVTQVRDLLGMAGDARLSDLVGHLVRGDLTDGLRVINDIVADGLDLRQFNRGLVDYLRRLLLVKVGSAPIVEASREELADLESLARLVSVEALMQAARLFSQLDLRYDGQSSLPMELAFIECLMERSKVGGAGGEPASSAPGPGRISPPKAAPAEAVHEPAAAVPPRAKSSPQAAVGEAEPVPQPVSPELAASDSEGFVRANWSRVLELLRAENRTLEQYVVFQNQDGPLAVEGDGLVLSVSYGIQRDYLEKPENKRIAEGVINRVLGKRFSIRCVVLPKTEEDRKKRAAEDPLIHEAITQGARIVKVE